MVPLMHPRALACWSRAPGTMPQTQRWERVRSCQAIRLILAAGVALAAGPASAHFDQVALTFDDLPAATVIASQAYVTRTNELLLKGLERHHLPAIGFVNEGKINELNRAKQIEVLKMWLDAGMSLGNHTYSHESANAITANQFIRDVARGAEITAPLLSERGRHLRWFRYPYLETGFPLKRKEAIKKWLIRSGYRIAPVTMENSDWLFSGPYDHAVMQRDKRQRLHIKTAYLSYTKRMVAWYRRAGVALFGRNIPYVMQLHVSRLNADYIDELARLLRHQGLRAVTLDSATRDPAYRIADTYVGPDGIEWLERWSLTLHRELPWDDFEEPPAFIQAASKREHDDR